ncbi:hypothetical protein R3X25_02730 [Lutibacter sp. TH_r2]|uniref:PID-CTERM protein-sorting domain-containing protein n=1 Tax=Lutibacter sp. TH_r2 TaxID=3082083 RepID=UPI002954D29D|nr:hypothetical protein [Lutibacter sp. TH_r2]MDV7186184.1 hypothetical protein [Lutibacter sp. TH_r2]
MKNKFNILLLTFSLLVFVNGYSQKTLPTPPPNGNKPAAPAPNPGLPVDGGLSYLLLSGILYGVYELRKGKKH